MRSVIIRPQNATVSTPSDNVGNNSRCSMAYLLQTRRRRFFSLVTILTIIVICGFAIPLVIILNVNEYTEQSVTTKNLTTSTLSTININGSNITSWGSL